MRFFCITAAGLQIRLVWLRVVDSNPIGTGKWRDGEVAMDFGFPGRARKMRGGGCRGDSVHLTGSGENAQLTAELGLG